MLRRQPRSTLFPTRRSSDLPFVRPDVVPVLGLLGATAGVDDDEGFHIAVLVIVIVGEFEVRIGLGQDRKSTRLNSSHGYISYAVFCLKKKKITMQSVTSSVS